MRSRCKQSIYVPYRVPTVPYRVPTVPYRTVFQLYRTIPCSNCTVPYRTVFQLYRTVPCSNCTYRTKPANHVSENKKPLSGEYSFGFRVNLFSLLLHVYFQLIYLYQKASVQRQFNIGEVDSAQRDEVVSSHSYSLFCIHDNPYLCSACAVLHDGTPICVPFNLTPSLYLLTTTLTVVFFYTFLT